MMFVKNGSTANCRRSEAMRLQFEVEPIFALNKWGLHKALLFETITVQDRELK